MFSPEFSFFSLIIVVAVFGAFFGRYCSGLVGRVCGQKKKRCAACGRKIGTIPVVSYVTSRGVCPKCGNHLPKARIILELTGTLLPFFLFGSFNFTLSGILDYFFLMLVLTAGTICFYKGQLPTDFCALCFIFPLTLLFTGQVSVSSFFLGLLTGLIFSLLISYVLGLGRESLIDALFSAVSGALLGPKPTVIYFLIFLILYGFYKLLSKNIPPAPYVRYRPLSRSLPARR